MMGADMAQVKALVSGASGGTAWELKVKLLLVVSSPMEMED